MRGRSPSLGINPGDRLPLSIISFLVNVLPLFESAPLLANIVCCCSVRFGIVFMPVAMLPARIRGCMVDELCDHWSDEADVKSDVL